MMKKTVLVFSMILSLSAWAEDQPGVRSESHAPTKFSVKGDKARALLLAIEGTGAKPTHFMDVVNLKVQNVQCSQDFKIVTRCELEQEVAGPAGTNSSHSETFIAENDKARGLIDALEDVGVKPTGNYLKKYSVESVNCTA